MAVEKNQKSLNLSVSLFNFWVVLVLSDQTRPHALVTPLAAIAGYHAKFSGPFLYTAFAYSACMDLWMYPDIPHAHAHLSTATHIAPTLLFPAFPKLRSNYLFSRRRDTNISTWVTRRKAGGVGVFPNGTCVAKIVALINSFGKIVTMSWVAPTGALSCTRSPFGKGQIRGKLFGNDPAGTSWTRCHWMIAAQSPTSRAVPVASFDGGVDSFAFYNQRCLFYSWTDWRPESAAIYPNATFCVIVSWGSAVWRNLDLFFFFCIFFSRGCAFSRAVLRQIRALFWTQYTIGHWTVGFWVSLLGPRIIDPLFTLGVTLKTNVYWL